MDIRYIKPPCRLRRVNRFRPRNTTPPRRVFVRRIATRPTIGPKPRQWSVLTAAKPGQSKVRRHVPSTATHRTRRAVGPPSVSQNTRHGGVGGESIGHSVVECRESTVVPDHSGTPPRDDRRNTRHGGVRGWRNRSASTALVTVPTAGPNPSLREHSTWWGDGAPDCVVAPPSAAEVEFRDVFVVQ